MASSRPGASMSPAISADGRYVVFASKADLTCTARGRCAEDNGVADDQASRHPDEHHEADQPQRFRR